MEIDVIDSRTTLWTDNHVMFKRLRREYPERNVLFCNKQPNGDAYGKTCYVGYTDSCDVVTRIGGVA